MKRTLTAATFAIALTAFAPATFAAGAADQLEASVNNHLRQLGSSIVLPDLTANQLAFLNGVLTDSDSSNDVKTSKVEFYLSKF